MSVPDTHAQRCRFVIGRIASQAVRAALAIVLVSASVLASGCGSGSSDSSASAGGGCKTVDAPAPRDPGNHAAPTQPLPRGKTTTLTFDTSCGSFTITLDPTNAPHASASLAALAKDGYFDDTIFHRVVPGFVIQGGDPTQIGFGGPGYSTVDPPPKTATYTKGVVAMAKTETEPAGTAGSQFFVVTGADAGLTPDYAIVGKVTDGMDTVMRIDALGVGDGSPSQPVVIDRVTVGER